MAKIRMSVAEVARDFAAVMARVGAGAEVVIEDGALAVAVIHTPTDPTRRSVSDCIALAKKHDDETGKAPVLDSDFASDVEEIVRNRKPWNPPAWD